MSDLLRISTLQFKCNEKVWEHWKRIKTRCLHWSLICKCALTSGQVAVPTYRKPVNHSGTRELWFIQLGWSKFSLSVCPDKGPVSHICVGVTAGSSARHLSWFSIAASTIEAASTISFSKNFWQQSTLLTELHWWAPLDGRTLMVSFSPQLRNLFIKHWLLISFILN